MSSIWQGMGSTDSPELERLALSARHLVLSSRAPLSKYLAAFKREVWAKEYKLPIFPVKEAHMMLYMQHLADTSMSKAAMEEALNAVDWIHSISVQLSPTETQR